MRCDLFLLNLFSCHILLTCRRVKKHAVLEWREYEKVMVEHGDDAAKEALADGSEELLGVAHTTGLNE